MLRWWCRRSTCGGMIRSSTILLVGLLLFGATPVSASEDAPPGPPVALRAWTDENGTALAWEPPVTGAAVDVDHYNVYEIDSGGRVELLGSTPDLGFLATTSDPGDLVAYVVTAVNEAGESVGSNPASPLGTWPWCNPVDLGQMPPIIVDCFFPLPIPPVVPP